MLNNTDNNSQACYFKAPTRIDLGGGTLDIPPIASILQENYQLWQEPIITLNIAIDLYAESWISAKYSDNFEFTFQNHNTGEIIKTNDLAEDVSSNFLLHRTVARYYKSALDAKGLKKVEIKSAAQAPKGSGLGGSSALITTMLAAMDKLLGNNSNPQKICHIAQYLEAGILRNLAGDQDHFAAAFGGVQAVKHSAEGVSSEQIKCDGEKLLEHMVIAWSNQEHFSAFNNWSILEKVLSGDKPTFTKLQEIANTTKLIKKALELNDYLYIGNLMSKEWEVRRSLAEGITTPQLNKMYNSAINCGAIGGKVCGAGGGGVLVMIVDDLYFKDKVINAIQEEGGNVLNAHFSAKGLQS